MLPPASPLLSNIFRWILIPIIQVHIRQHYSSLLFNRLPFMLLASCAEKTPPYCCSLDLSEASSRPDIGPPQSQHFTYHFNLFVQSFFMVFLNETLDLSPLMVLSSPKIQANYWQPPSLFLNNFKIHFTCTPVIQYFKVNSRSSVLPTGTMF